MSKKLPRKRRSAKASTFDSAAFESPDQSKSQQSPAPAKEPEKTWFQKYWLPALVTLVTTLAAGLTLAYFKGELGRKPAMRAAFEKPTVQTNVTVRDFLTERGLPIDGYPEPDLAQVGYVVNFKVQIDGFKGRICRVRAELFDAETRARIVPPGWNAVQEPVDFKPERDSDAAAAAFWIPPTGSDKPFFVRVRLFDDKKVELDYEDSDAIKPPAAVREAEPSASPSANGNATPTATPN